MATIAEIAKLAQEITTVGAIEMLFGELNTENRKGAIQALLDVHLSSILQLAAAADEERRLRKAAEETLAAQTDNGLTKPDPAAAAKPIGTVYSESGLVIVADALNIDAAWTERTNAHGGYVVDIIGEQHEYLANRQQGGYQQTEIPGDNGETVGTRIHCKTVREAMVVMDQSKSLAERNQWNTRFDYMSKGASYTLALDAVREQGAVAVAKKDPLQIGILRVTPKTHVQIRKQGNRILVG